MQVAAKLQGRLGDRRLLTVWALSVLAVTVPFWGLVVGRETAIFDDLIVYHLPTMSWIGDLLVHGHLPQWGQWAFGGQNVVGIGQGAVFYPLTMLFGVFNPVVGYRIWLVAHLWIGTTGAFVWSWRNWHSRAGAAVSGIGYGLNGFIVMHLAHMNFTIASAWFPWLLVGIDLVHHRWSTRRALAAALPLTFIATSGHPQMLWMALMICGVYSLAVLARRSTSLQSVLRVGGALALGLGLAAISLLPQYAFSGSSVRSAHTMSSAFELGAGPNDLAVTIFPHIMGGGSDLPGVRSEWLATGIPHEVATHTGIIVLACAVFGVLATWRNRRTIGLVVLALYGVTTALPTKSPVAHLAFHVVPLAGAFRAWGRNMVLLNLSASMLAGAGVVAIVQADRARRQRMAVGTVTVTLLAIAVSVATKLKGAIVPMGDLLPALAVPLLCVTALVLALLFAHRNMRTALAVVAVACAGNMAFFAYGAEWRSLGMPTSVAEPYFTDGLPVTGSVDDSPGGIDRWVSDDLQRRGLAMINDTSSVVGYDPLLQKSWATVTGAEYFGEYPDDRMWGPGWFADVLRINTAYLTEAATVDPSWSDEGIPADSNDIRYTRSPRLPEAYVVGNVETATLPEIATRLQRPDADFEHTVLLDDAGDAFAGRTDSALTATVSGAMSDHGTGRFDVTSSGPGVLVISSTWLDGWEATVNGRSVPVTRANGLVLGIPVEKGQSIVTLQFRAPGLRTGALISLACVLVFIGSAMVSVVRRRRASAALLGRAQVAELPQQ